MRHARDVPLAVKLPSADELEAIRVALASKTAADTLAASTEAENNAVVASLNAAASQVRAKNLDTRTIQALLSALIAGLSALAAAATDGGPIGLPQLLVAASAAASSAGAIWGVGAARNTEHGQGRGPYRARGRRAIDTSTTDRTDDE